ncbi:hypothetical protein [Burkholderia sp. TSV86]|uniref:hypothetical protein n=1 Tax=Burkholderia sp. TSV86 TaxID=1385594 RepID=UPI00075CF03E|nr:hypothetical protein [Burkholderia sp. TSV86]KVE35500.1 hypothetical protein WS68_05970 [Burkholderia sp. TSV86]
MIDRTPNAMLKATRNAVPPREPVRKPCLRCMPAHGVADAGANAGSNTRATAIAKTAPEIDEAEPASVPEWFRTVG